MIDSKKLDWASQVCVILASGPSLTGDQVVALEGKDVKTIAVNSTWLAKPDTDVIFAVDFLWWKENIRTLRKTCMSGRLWTQDATAASQYSLNRIKGVNRPGLGLQHIHPNGNGGFAAINLAFLFGCRRILLVGYDMKLGRKGQKHWHADHPNPLMQAQCFEEWIHKSVPLAADLKREGCEVINCSGDTALTCWPRSTIEKELS